MSLLQQDFTELDDAARGEELTRGTSHLVWAAVIATLVIAAAIAAYDISARKPPAATGEILAVWACPHHSETSGVDANGEPTTRESFDQVLVFTRVRLHNQSDHPLVLANTITNATLNDGIHSSYAASKSDYARIFIAYPNLAAPQGTALSPQNTRIEAGQTIEGEFVSSFLLTKQAWDARKKLDYTFSFQYQPKLTLAPHVAVTER